MLGRAFLAAFLAGSLGAQTSPAPAPQQSPIEVHVNEVVVTVTVQDDQGRFVSNLDKDNFKIYDEGVDQNIIYFNRDRNQPVVVGFLIDVSNTNRLHWKTFQEAALDLVNTLLPGDPKFSGYLITYGNEATLRVNTNNDPEKMMDAIRKAKPGGGAALFDAIYMACTSRDLVKGEPLEPRRVIVIIGDGHDTASKKSLAEVLELAQRNQVTIFGISTRAFGFEAQGDSNLKTLAEETGGRVEYPLNSLYKDVSGYVSHPTEEGNYVYKVGTGGYASAISTGLFNAIANIAGEITTQYVLMFRPDNTDSGSAFRHIRVEVSLPNVKITHKSGYYPSAP